MQQQTMGNKPVATQLERIEQGLDKLEAWMEVLGKNQDQDREAISGWVNGVEQGLDKLLQSHAALAKQHDDEICLLNMRLRAIEHALAKPKKKSKR